MYAYDPYTFEGSQQDGFSISAWCNRFSIGFIGSKQKTVTDQQRHSFAIWLRMTDLHRRSLGYEPSEFTTSPIRDKLGAGNEDRTRDLMVGNQPLYH
jgi:hypothetical protein